MNTEPQADPKAEIQAMSKAYEALKGLDHDGWTRAIDWLTARLSNDSFRREQARRAASGQPDDEEPF